MKIGRTLTAEEIQAARRTVSRDTGYDRAPYLEAATAVLENGGLELTADLDEGETLRALQRRFTSAAKDIAPNKRVKWVKVNTQTREALPEGTIWVQFIDPIVRDENASARRGRKAKASTNGQHANTSAGNEDEELVETE